jgi:hypothetical protein
MKPTKKKTFIRLPAWAVRWNVLERLLLTDVFPDKTYETSKWASWEERIRREHDVEKERIDRIYDKRMKGRSGDLGYDPAELAGEDYWETCRLTNSMYAALVVAMWSDMEHLLKGLVQTCSMALARRDKALKMTIRFCQESLNHKPSKISAKQCIKALRIVSDDIPSGFGDIKSLIRHMVAVDADTCSDHTVVDTIRLLNNAFKHNDGRYETDAKTSNARAVKMLLDRWGVLDERNEIDYSKLPIKRLVAACRAFCDDLMGRVEDELKKRTAGTKRVVGRSSGSTPARAEP